MAKKNDTTFFENKLLDFVTAKDFGRLTAEEFLAQLKQNIELRLS